jgi:hypothetical protein
MYRSRNGLPRESLGLRQWRRENAMRGKLIKFQSESVMARCLSRRNRRKLIHPRRNGAHYRVYVKGDLMIYCT